MCVCVGGGCRGYKKGKTTIKYLVTSPLVLLCLPVGLCRPLLLSLVRAALLFHKTMAEGGPLGVTEAKGQGTICPCVHCPTQLLNLFGGFLFHIIIFVSSERFNASNLSGSVLKCCPLLGASAYVSLFLTLCLSPIPRCEPAVSSRDYFSPYPVIDEGRWGGGGGR